MLIVQKYGGATLADAGRVRSVAERIARQVSEGHRVVAVVSAMGSTTNELIRLAHQVSPRPTLREMDMLLTTGERISMSLVSMALNHLGVKATSLTGSQAGILTDDSHSNAHILDVKAFRVDEALAKGNVVVLAGFQGVSPSTKEITTLGRGGTDTTAIAMAAYLNAHHCEILKEVPAVFTADPRLVPSAKPIRELGYGAMAEMTFWGAKVLHHRSAELAWQRRVPVYVGPAHEETEGTWIREKGETMYEKGRILSLNSHERVLRLRCESFTCDQALECLESEWEKSQVPSPLILSVERSGEGVELWAAGPSEIIAALEKWVAEQSRWSLIPGVWCSVTATCAGASSPGLVRGMTSRLAALSIAPVSCRWSSMSVSFLIPASDREKAIRALHELMP